MVKRTISRVMTVLVLAGLVFSLSGCYGIPKGTTEITHVGKLQLRAKGAGLVTADTEKTTFRIKCVRCGFEMEEITIDTPAVGNPYISNRVCPKCQHRQTMIIEASGL